LFETPKEIGNKLLDKINGKIRKIKMQRKNSVLQYGEMFVIYLLLFANIVITKQLKIIT